MFGKVVRFLKEVKTELKKVNWPTRRELIGSTIVTIVVVLIVSVFIGIVDRLLSLATRQIFG
jgi:preprotein translocase subunit SecE